MEYTPLKMERVIKIEKLYSLHYFQFAAGYIFPGEKHNFWEMVYIDRGEADIGAGKQVIRLRQGQAIFHQPSEYHNLRANGVVAPNLVVIAFQCQSPAMDFFRRKTVFLSDTEKHLLANIIFEAKEAFDSPLEDPTLKKLERKKDALFGAEQMISLSLEHFLISLHRSYGDIPFNTTTLHRGFGQGVVSDVVSFLQENIQEKLVFQQVLDRIGISASSLKSVFKETMGMGVMNYFTKMKMETAKKLIREGNLNITQIANSLGYDSIHLLSRRFRQMTGMSPTEYGKSVKIEFENIR